MNVYGELALMNLNQKGTLKKESRRTLRSFFILHTTRHSLRRVCANPSPGPFVLTCPRSHQRCRACAPQSLSLKLGLFQDVYL